MIHILKLIINIWMILKNFESLKVIILLYGQIIHSNYIIQKSLLK
jgi:hypothetical protein